MLLLGGEGGGIPKKNARLTLLLTLTLVLGLFDHRCFALECYQCLYQKGHPANFENCGSGGGVPKFKGKPSVTECDPGDKCGIIQSVYKGELQYIMVGCVEPPSDCQKEHFGGNPDCYEVTNAKLDEVSKACRGKSGARAAGARNSISSIPSVDEMRRGAGGESVSNGTSSSSSQSREEILWDAVVNNCACSTDKCNDYCKCSPKSQGSLMVISGMAIMISTVISLARNG